MTGDELRAARERLGLSIRALARALGRQPSTILRMERAEKIEGGETIRLALERLAEMRGEK